LFELIRFGYGRVLVWRSEATPLVSRQAHVLQSNCLFLFGKQIEFSELCHTFLVLMCLTSSFFKNFLDNISIHIIFLKKTGILFLGLAKRKVFDKELKMMNFLGESNKDVLTKQNLKRFGSDRFGVAEIERENILEQTMNGRREKARQGLWNGGPAPYGYLLKDNRLYINEEEAELIRLIFDKYANTTIGYTGIAKYLNLQGIILFLQVQTFGKREKCLKYYLRDYLKQQHHYYTLTKVGNTK
jgi:hypothetical protein